MADTVEIAGVNFGSKRRVVIDLTLATVIIACFMAFAELRTTVNTLRENLPSVNSRLDAIESRERQTREIVATKADVARLEEQVREIRSILLNERIRR